MKNFFKKIKTYSFWVSLSGAIIVLLNAFGNAFGFEIENKIIEDCVMSIASILVVLGIVSNGKNSKENATNDVEIDEEQTNDVEEEILIDDCEKKEEDDVTEKE